jgi:hypothetical protein
MPCRAHGALFEGDFFGSFVYSRSIPQQKYPDNIDNADNGRGYELVS